MTCIEALRQFQSHRNLIFTPSHRHSHPAASLSLVSLSFLRFLLFSPRIFSSCFLSFLPSTCSLTRGNSVSSKIILDKVSGDSLDPESHLSSDPHLSGVRQHLPLPHPHNIAFPQRLKQRVSLPLLWILWPFLPPLQGHLLPRYYLLEFFKLWVRPVLLLALDQCCSV